MEIFTLFNKPKSHQKCRQYYPVTIPLRVSKNGQTVSGLDANWLEHMSDHFRKGGTLVNAVFYLGMVNGMEVTALLWPLRTLLLTVVILVHLQSPPHSESSAADNMLHLISN
ncbi:hypothetical protein HPG69_013021 [Diceros bicornis minor]|uniref:Uncharacterized protein n=1 Tax=Diceros bicornis minor TaxID=77932 RepID=A0A7J7F1L8_DICBM|nr:hypothetical protein HPG69_013021 [Diceros bicornis minor]